MEEIARTQSWATFFEERVQRQNDAMLAALTADAATISGCRAICMIDESAHDYTTQQLVIQMEDSSYHSLAWNSATQTTATQPLVSFSCDLTAELARLRASDLVMRSRHNTNTDLQTGASGRYATLFIAVGHDGEWVAAPKPLVHGTYQNNAFNRIYAAFSDSHDAITLV